MSHEAGHGRELERELVENYPDLALLLRRTAQMHAWQPSVAGEQVLRRLAEGVAIVLEQRLPSEEAEAYMAGVIAETQAWLGEQQHEQGQSGRRDGCGR